MNPAEAQADPRKVRAVENTDKITEMFSDFIREKYGEEPDMADLKIFGTAAMAALNYIFFSVIARNGQEVQAVEWQKITTQMTFKALRELGGVNIDHAIAYREPAKENKDGP